MKFLEAFRCCFLPLAALLLFACERYEPEGEYFKEVKVKEPGLLQIKLNPAGGDTLIARNDTYFSFEVPEQVREELGYRLYLGSELLEENPNPPDNVLFESYKRQDGFYKLRLELYVKTNTGSMADISGMEFFVYEYDWVLKIDNRPASNYPIHQFSVTEEEGRIKLSWPEYDLPKFRNYMIIRRETGGRERCQTVYISDPKQTHIYDDSFVGGSYTYTMYVNLNEYPADVSGSPQKLEAPFPHLLDQEQREEAFSLAWSSCRYPKNFEAYEIYRQDTYGLRMVYSSTNIEDTTAVLPAAFGTMTYQLHTKAKAEPEERGGPVSEFSLSYGQSHSLPFIPLYLKGENAYLLQSDYGSLTKYDAASLEPLLSRQFSGHIPTISDNGAYIYYSEGTEVVRLNPGTLEEVERISVESLTGYAGGVQRLAVNNQNQLLLAGVYTSGSAKDSLILVDMNKKEVLSRLYYEVFSGGTLSNDGRYFLQGTVTLIDLYQDQYSILEEYAFWLPQKPSRLVYATNGGIVVMDPENRQLLKEIPTPGRLLNLETDPLTGYVGGVLYRGEQIFYQIYNVETAELLKETEVNTPYISFRNNTLFTTDSYLPLSLP